MSIPVYTPHNLEKTIQNYWITHNTFTTQEKSEKSGQKNFYCLAMIPYPSGSLHMGHVRNYTLSDVIARYQRLQGYNVLHPMGWDAFGLPAENAAIKHHVPPAQWTENNICAMRTQLQTLGYGIDWEREIKTCDPDYYRWEQWLFLQLYKKGLAYQKRAWVNWDPIDNTVLANEQVVDGKGWRSGALVERKEINQWFFKITQYTEELLEDLTQLTEWPPEVIRMQSNWIGRSTGTEVHFSLVTPLPDLKKITVFTTRADTLLGATYLAIAPEHPLAHHALAKQPALASALALLKNTGVSEAILNTQEKLGVDSELSVYHPLTGEKIPVWIANFVLGEYGSGAVMSVPAHDARDHAFAKKYALPIKPVIQAPSNWDFTEAAYLEKGTLINSGPYDQLSSHDAIEAITKELTKNKAGKERTTYRLRDWGISRQRYWGTPIPIIHCANCGTVPVPESDLPVHLPTHLLPDGKTSPLCSDEDFLSTHCPRCGKPARRETDTMDTFVESSWYYARYCSYNQSKRILDNRANDWLPVSQYIGGIEHAILHLLYARFIHKVLRDLGFVSSDEPFGRLLTQGMVLKNGEKMSKSKGNSVAPEPLIQKYGADALRFFIIFSAPPTQTLEWSDQGVEGAYRFLKKLWHIAHLFEEEIQLINKKPQQERDFKFSCPTLKQSAHTFYVLLDRSCKDMERQHFNTVASSAMKLLNLAEAVISPASASADSIQKLPFIQTLLSALLRILSPITPHISQYLWNRLGFGADISVASFPKVAPHLLEIDTIPYVIQVNGKRRAQVDINSDASEAEAVAIAQSHPRVTEYLAGVTLQKVIFVPKKLLNFVVTVVK